MKILVDGDLSKVYRTEKFECDRCGCVFEATNQEYDVRYDYSGVDHLSVTCPCCESRVYRDRVSE